MSSPPLPSQSVPIGHNTVAGYVGMIFGVVLNLVMVPLYVHYLGPESYGLVGFVAILYAGLTFLDVGLSATLGREMARFRGGEYTADEIGQLIGTFEKIFVGVAVIFALAVIALSGFLAHDWFKARDIDPVTLQTAVCLMGLIVAVRWSGTLYRSGMLGLERIVWVNTVSIATSLGYAAAVLVVLMFWPDVRLFFACQLAVGLIDILIVRTKLQSSLGASAPIHGFSVQVLRDHWKFSLSIALISSLWIATIQTDKLVLSNVLSLKEFGYFSVAVYAAFSVTALYGPIGQALRPRMSFHVARNEMRSVQEFVLLAAQVTFVMSAPLALTFALVPHSVLFSWTGDPAVFGEIGPVFALYALGNLGAALVTPSSYLQIALGDLRLQIIGRIAFVVVLVPTILFATFSYGMWGAAVVWSLENFVYLALWVPVMFRQALPSVIAPWARLLLLQSAALGTVFLALWWLDLDHWGGQSRMLHGAVSLGVWTVFGGVSLLLNPTVAKGALRTFRNLRNSILPRLVRS